MKYCTVPFYIEHISLGALGDSFYEYLLKSWLMTSKHDVEARDMYFESVSAIMNKLVKHTSTGLTYITDMKNGRPDSKMQHLVSHLEAMLFVCRYYTFNVPYLFMSVPLVKSGYCPRQKVNWFGWVWFRQGLFPHLTYKSAPFAHGCLIMLWAIVPIYHPLINKYVP